MSYKMLVSEDGKKIRLVAHVMRKVGDDIQVTIDGVTGLARKNDKRQLTYVTVGEEALRVPVVLVDGGVYTTEEYTPKAKAAPELDADGNPIVKARKPRAVKEPVLDPAPRVRKSKAKASEV